MSSKRNKLNALADIFQAENLEGNISKIPLERIKPAEEQPRRDATLGIDELAKSLQSVGLLQPIVVTKTDGNDYMIIAGERRYRAAKKLGWNDIECKLLHKDRAESYRLAVIENAYRKNLNPFDEANALKTLKRLRGYTDKELAEAFNKSRSTITELLSISQIPEEILKKAEQSGIESKNLLIQLYQAFKKGVVDDFLNAYKNGELDSVKEAKQFNVSRANTARKKTTSQSPKLYTDYSLQNTDNVEFHITLKPGKRKISDKEAQKIQKEIKKILNKYASAPKN